MIYVLIPILVILLTIAAVKGKNALEYRKVYGLSGSEVNDLSWPAQEIMKRFHAMPVESRPDTNMLEIVKALDTKHNGVEKVNDFYSKESYRGEFEGYSWNAMRETLAVATDFRSLYDGMGLVIHALAERERELAMYRISYSLGAATSIAQQLSEEAGNIRAGTKEMTRDPLELR